MTPRFNKSVAVVENAFISHWNNRLNALCVSYPENHAMQYGGILPGMELTSSNVISATEYEVETERTIYIINSWRQ